MVRFGATYGATIYGIRKNAAAGFLGAVGAILVVGRWFNRMATYAFTPAERWAVFTTHRGKCWLCYEPVNFADMAVDHILPEFLSGDQLNAALTAFGLPSDFELNSFENWLPAHGPCNSLKGSRVFQPTPLIQEWIERAREKADAARAARDKSRSTKEIEKAIGILSTGKTLYLTNSSSLVFNIMRPLTRSL